MNHPLHEKKIDERIDSWTDVFEIQNTKHLKKFLVNIEKKLY